MIKINYADNAIYLHVIYRHDHFKIVHFGDNIGRIKKSYWSMRNNLLGVV